MAKRALITGITGQDGSYLAELLLGKGYEVHGVVRRSSSVNRSRIDHLRNSESGPNPQLRLHYGDLADSVALVKLLYELQPDEVYNLAAQSHVRVSFEIPEYTSDITGVGAGRILEAVIESGIGKKVRFYQASSSEMFGKVQAVPQRESTPFYPRSPYGCAKAFAHYLTVNYRESYGLFACGGILFNHESPRRGESFVTRKITLAAARIKLGLQKELHLGNLDARRDWGYAPDYVRGMWLALQQPEAGDYVFATGITHTIRELAAAAFGAVGLDWETHVTVNPDLLRPSEPDRLAGNPAKARAQLGWKPSLGFAEMIRAMTLTELEALQATSA